MNILLDFAVLIALYFLIFFKKWRRRGNDVFLVNTLMYIYLSFVLYFTLMPIISALPFILDHPYVPMNMTPFIDVTHGRGDFVRQIALNIIMTVPFGFLPPLTVRNSIPPGAPARQTARTVFLGLLRVLFLTFLLSFTIETLQPLLHSFRSADITDLITNVLGGLLGYLFYLVFRPLAHNFLDLLKKPSQNPSNH